MMDRLLAGVLLAWVPVSGSAVGQFGDLAGGGARAARQQREYVTYAPEPAVVAAGKRSVVEVHLVVAPGYHVNSHAPKSELLIPTIVTLDGGDAGVKVEPVDYPKGASYSFAGDPGEVLDVYTGAVVLRVPVTAAAGEHVLKGLLHYQACDQRACYPPRTLPIEVPFTAK